MKTLFWDIEATHLAASIGSIVCIGYKWEDELDPTIISLSDHRGWKKDPTDDSKILEAFEEVYLQADMQVTWYGKRFDFPYIQTRRLSYGMLPLPAIPHFDGWETARKKLKFHSNRLATVQDFLELEAEKTPLSFKALSKCMSGNEEALDEVEYHCWMDVLVLEQAYERLKAFGGNFHPNAAILGGKRDCPTCGSGRTIRRGTQIAVSRAYWRYQCQDCGRWFREAKPLPNAAEVR